MLLPMVALCAFALLQLVTVGRDAVTVQEAARVGARVAATTHDDGRVRHAVREVLGPYRGARATITVQPPDRRSGDTVTVEVSFPSRFGPFEPVVGGRAVSRGEPILGRTP